jgi:hypothetical protein
MCYKRSSWIPEYNAAEEDQDDLEEPAYHTRPSLLNPARTKPALGERMEEAACGQFKSTGIVDERGGS